MFLPNKHARSSVSVCGWCVWLSVLGDFNSTHPLCCWFGLVLHRIIHSHNEAVFSCTFSNDDWRFSGDAHKRDWSGRHTMELLPGGPTAIRLDHTPQTSQAHVDADHEHRKHLRPLFTPEHNQSHVILRLSVWVSVSDRPYGECPVDEC